MTSRQRALSFQGESLDSGASFVGRIFRVRFERLGAVCLSVGVGLYAHGASIDWRKARAGVLLLSQILVLVRVLDTLKQALAESDWSASHRDARIRDQFCLLGDSHNKC